MPSIAPLLTEAELVRSLVGLAVRSKLAGPLLPLLARFGGGELAAEARALGLDLKRTAMVRNSGVLDAILEVDVAMREAGLAYAVMKGPMQQSALHGDPFMRPSGDLDLLVAPRDFAAATAVIAGLGFTQTPPGRSLWWTRFLGERHLVRDGRPRANVDVHHRLQQPGSPQPRSSQAFLRRARTQILRGAAIPVLGAADVPLLSAMSLVKALFNREPAGSHAFDLLKALDGGRDEPVGSFVERARSEKLEGTARVALRLLEALRPAPGMAAREAAGERRDVLGWLQRETLCAMVLQPEAVPSWPQRRTILREACLRDPVRTARELAWLGLSEAARWTGERASRGRAASSDHLEQAT